MYFKIKTFYLYPPQGRVDIKYTMFREQNCLGKNMDLLTACNVVLSEVRDNDVLEYVYSDGATKDFSGLEIRASARFFKDIEEEALVDKKDAQVA